MEESVTFWNRLHAFFVTDDRLRWKIMAWIMAASGVIGSAEFAFSNESLDDVLFLMSSFVLLSYFVCIVWYCSFRRPSHLAKPSFTFRRAVLRFVVAASVGFAISIGLVRKAIYTMTLRLQEVANDPTSQFNMKEANRILDRAQAAQIKIAPATIRRTANSFIMAAKENPGAWDTSIEFLNYTSFLNISHDPSPRLQEIPKGSGLDFTNPVPGTINISFLGLTTPENVPQWRRIDSTEPNPRDARVRVPQYFKIQAETVTLDGFYLRHIILDSTHVIYHGGQIRLEDVYFVNCTFEFEREANDRNLDFAKAILNGEPSVTFDA
jgi:hypothetical protein